MIETVSRETRARLDTLTRLIVAENGRQNLVSASTIADFETRHIDDSMQLLALCRPGTLLDIGSGAGLPGLALACAWSGAVHLVEPRTKRAEFLVTAAQTLGLHNVVVHPDRVERVFHVEPDTITARAVAKLSAILVAAEHLAQKDTRWVLPKGRSAQSELEEARGTWQGEFELVSSRTDPDAAIVVASQIQRRDA